MNDYTRLFDIIYYQAAQFHQHDSFCRKENGQWTKYSTSDCIDTVSYTHLTLPTKRIV